MEKTNETNQTKIDNDIDTGVLEIPKYGYGKQFDNKLVRFVGRGTFWSNPTDMEKQNLDQTKLNEEGKLQRWWGKLDRPHTVKKADGEEIQVEAIQLTRTQNDKLTRLGTDQKTIDEMFKDGSGVKLVCCEVQKKSGIGGYWDLLTITQYKERFEKDPLE